MYVRQIYHDFPVHKGDFTVQKFERLGMAISTSLTIEYHNNMSVPVVIKTSMGHSFRKPAAIRIKGPETFDFHITHVFAMEDVVDARGFVNETNFPDTPAEQKDLNNQLANLTPSMQTPPARRLSYTLQVTREQLEQANGVLYVNYLDVVIGLASMGDEIIHPFTREGVVDGLNKHAPKEEGLNQRYYLVDNQRRFGNRYINIWGRVEEVQAIHDPAKEEGLYITVSNRGKVDTRFYPLEEAEKNVGLYPTYKEAELYGQPDVWYKQQAEERTRELKNEQHKLEVDKVNLQREKMEIEKEKDKLERSRKDFDLEMEQQRNRMTQRREEYIQQLDLEARESKQKHERQTAFWKSVSLFISAATTIIGGALLVQKALNK
jgi:hypothetical protein